MGVSSSKSAFRPVRMTPGAVAFTVTRRFDHPAASERVSETAPALLAVHAATSLSAKKP
jgi:hypothetical protein